MIRALARAHRWKLLLEGKYRSAGEIAEAEKVTQLRQPTLRLTLFALDIIEAILEGRLRKGMVLEELAVPMPSTWEEQRERFARSSKPRSDVATNRFSTTHEVGTTSSR